MPSTDYRRRRRRRRLSRLGILIVTLAILVVLGILVLVGGISRANREAAPYWRDIDRSYAAQVRSLVRQSDAVDSQFRSVVAGMATDTRARLEASLDTLVSATKALSREASTAATPAPAAGAGADISRAMAERSAAVADVRTTVDGLLGMSPLVDAGAGATASVAAPGALSATAAASKLQSVSALLGDADRLYGAGRHALVGAPGHARLPASVWLRRTVAWTSGGAQTVVRRLVDSPSLAAVHDVVLVPHALVLTPAPVPPAQGSATTTTLHLPPTTRLSLTAVVADTGNVAERGVVVDEQVQAPGGRPSTGRSHRVSVSAHGEVSVRLPALPVGPAVSYTLTVRVVPSIADPAGAGTTETLSLSIAAPAPATVLQLTPPSGRATGGTTVTIIGKGFTSVGAVDFGKVAAHFTVDSPTVITAVAPPGTGTVTVRVVNPGGTSMSSAASRFTYKVPTRKTTG